MSNKFNSFNDLADFYADEVKAPDYMTAMMQQTDMAQLSIVEDPTDADMPDPEMAQRAMELMMATCFDLFRDTRLEEFAGQIAWGICDTFTRVARRVEGQADSQSMKLKDMVNSYDPSEIYSVQLEETTIRARSLQEASDALACMRDHAAAIFASETGRPYSTARGSMTSSRHSASVIDARDFLAARSQQRREQHSPSGPVVAFSGGQMWEDPRQIEQTLDAVKQRIPSMTLATTAQNKGADIIAQAWAARNNVPVVLCRLDRSHGNRAGFVRNDRMVGMNVVEAIVCEGSGIQINLAQKLRQRQVPTHIIRLQRAPQSVHA